MIKRILVQLFPYTFGPSFKCTFCREITPHDSNLTVYSDVGMFCSELCESKWWSIENGF